MKRLLQIYLGIFFVIPTYAQRINKFSYRIETSAVVANNNQAPLWMTANRYGVNSNEEHQFFLRTGLFYGKELKYNWNVDAGVDLMIGDNLISNFWIHQAYMDFSWKLINISIGSKERTGFPLMKNERLSSGWMVEGINTRPIPQVRVALKEYFNIPGMREWLSIKGHIAFGWFTDGGWKENFVGPNQRYMKKDCYHSKSVMFRLGKAKTFPLEFEFGLLLDSHFSGDQYVKLKDGSSQLTLSMPKGVKAYWKALIPQAGGADNPVEGERTNLEGDVLGSWNFSLNWYPGNWIVRSYYEHYFDDHSQMFWEYGRWKDGQLGFELMPPKNKWLSSIVWECMSTKDQTGPFEAYGDLWPNENFLHSGGDNYYNHTIYQAWQFYGMGMGNPLIPGIIYNKEGVLQFRSNRVRSHHLGVSGMPSNEWNWRMLASFARHWGTYKNPLDKQRKQFSGLLEMTYLPKWAKGWSVSASLGLDRGNYLGNHIGGMVSFRKYGVLSL